MKKYADTPTKETNKKNNVTMASAFKTIIWPRRNLVFIGLLLRKQYAIPAGGIASDIGDTLSVSSFGSRGTRASRSSARGDSG